MTFWEGVEFFLASKAADALVLCGLLLITIVVSVIIIAICCKKKK